MQQPKPLDIIQNGTPVIVGNRKGTVINCEIVPAHPCGMIAVHTIKFTEQKKILAANRIKWVPVKKEKTERINYASIWY